MGAISKLQEARFVLTAVKGTLDPKKLAKAGNEAIPNAIADLQRERNDLLELLSVTRIGTRVKGDARSEVARGSGELRNSIDSLTLRGAADTAPTTAGISKSIEHLDEAMKNIAARRVKTAIATLVVGGAATITVDASA